MKRTENNSTITFPFENLDKIVKKSPTLLKHLAESKKIFSQIPKEELNKILNN